MAPVHLPTEVSPLTAPRASQLLGYLAMAWHKEPLLQVQSGLLILNGTVALILAIGIGVGFQSVLRRLTAPLDRLARVIQRLRAGEIGARTPVAGPAETREIGHAFNALLDDIERHRAELERRRQQLERQRRELESLVEMRTQDLRAARDAALTAARYKSEFMAAITHEMRMPLQSIIGYTREGQKALVFLEEEADPVVISHFANCLGMVRQASDDLLSRINQVLDLAALEAGKQDLQLEIVDLPVLLEEVVALLKPLIERNGNRVEILFEGLHRTTLDEDKTRQIIRNLLDNACKFTRAGLVLVEVTCTRDELVIEVADCGTGIPHPLQDLIFEPFRQADM
ncbi:MAG TPA: HAMP domain-containing sensor histidine kinase, partial [Candidatus Competibacter sp.]|nr:HAMP domain-containing sensor histidine kinase [Candidatus Competibacter sp.]